MAHKKCETSNTSSDVNWYLYAWLNLEGIFISTVKNQDLI